MPKARPQHKLREPSPSRQLATPTARDIPHSSDCHPWVASLPSVSSLRDISQCAEHETSEDRPCRALYFFIQITQGLVALAGLRTLGFEKGRPYRGLAP